MSGTSPGLEIRAAAAAAFPLAVHRGLEGALKFHGEQEVDGAARYVLGGSSGTRVTVRVDVIPMPAGTLARLHTNTTADSHVIQLSDSADPGAAGELLAVQLAEMQAIRDSAARTAVPRPLDLLVPGPALPVSPSLTASDLRRLEDLNRAASDMNDPAHSPGQRVHARARFSFLLDDLGLRPAGQGTGDAAAARIRRAMAVAKLTPAAAAALEDLARPPGQLPAADATALRQRRAAARQETGRRPGTRPGTLAPRWRDLPDLVLEARKARSQRSLATLDWLGEQQARLPAGRHPRVTIMIGGGAALSGRHPQMLVVDGRAGWHAAAYWSLAQTADQLRKLPETGLGDPYEFALSGQRVPLDALRYWEDLAAARGPVINGTAVLRPGGDGMLLADITPDDGSPPLTVEAAGAPVIATGFPAERPPGYALPVPTLAAAARVLASHYPDAWADITEALAGETPGRELAAWLRRAGYQAPGEPGPGLLDHAAQTVGATAAWETARLQAPGLVVTGDEVGYGKASPLAAERWLIAGTGGSSYTAAEIILDANPDAKVVMVGIGAREPVRNLALYTSVTRAHVAAHGGDGRLTVVDGQPLIGQVGTAWKAGRPVFSVRGHEGDAVVACLGRAGILPAAAEPLARWAHGRHGRVTGDLMYDDHQHYLGYRVVFSAGRLAHEVEVTGAASRALPVELFPPAILRRVAAEWARDIPPETGNVPGGFLPTAEQARNYLTARDPAWTHLIPWTVQPPPAAPGRRRSAGAVTGRGRSQGGRTVR